MTYVCLWTPHWLTGAGAPPAAEGAVSGDRSRAAEGVLEGVLPEVAARLLEVAPRVRVERRGVVWADARGLSGPRLAEELVERAGVAGVGGLRAGVAAVPVAAECAALAPLGRPDAGMRRGGGDGAAGGVRVVDVGLEREFLAPLPLELLGPDTKLLSLLDGVGIRCCGELAVLDREAVEVRFGPEGVGLWRLARADDARRLFGPIPPERPHASLDFIDYVVTDPERLLFTANALLESVTAALRSRGEHARELLLTLALANGEVWRRALRPARPTARREAWLRLARTALERLSVPDAVAGVSLQVETTEAAAVQQGDLFDRGFATATAVEMAVARLIESQGPVIVEPERSTHPLVERRTRWVPGDPFASHSTAPLDRPDAGAELRAPPVHSDAEIQGGARRVSDGEGGGGEPGPRLSLQLLPEPRPIQVETMERRGDLVPARYRDAREWERLVTVAGPDRISGGQWEGGYAREYFRCVTAGGTLVWLFRDGRGGAWYLHGWWD